MIDRHKKEADLSVSGTRSTARGRSILGIGAWLAAAVTVALGTEAYAEIAGPGTAATDYSFTLTWSHPTESTTLKDVSPGSLHTGGSATFAKSAGTYEFAEIYCVEIPPNDYGDIGQACVTVDTHTVTVAGTPAVVEAPNLQAAYAYTLRSGDFDGNGRTDVLIERTSTGAIDGSLQTVMLMQDTSGALSSKVPTPTELTAAQAFAANSALSLDAVDFNYDGYVDQMVTGLSSIGANAAGYLVVAPGGRRGSAPLAVTAMDDAFHQFFDDLGESFKDSTYWSRNIHVTIRHVYRVGVSCSLDFSIGFGTLYRDRWLSCYPQIYRAGTVVAVAPAFSVDALSAKSFWWATTTSRSTWTTSGGSCTT